MDIKNMFSAKRPMRRTPVRIQINQPPKRRPLTEAVHGYLNFLIMDKEYMIYLYGGNPHIVQIRTYSSYENVAASQRAWISRPLAVFLLSKFYWKKGVQIQERVYSEVWVRKCEYPDSAKL